MAGCDVVSFPKETTDVNILRYLLLTTCSVVQPLFSWSQFSVTELAFRRLLASLQTFTPFLRVVHAFGKKTNDTQRARDSVYYRVQLLSAYG